MTERRLEDLSREELVRELTKTHAAADRFAKSAADPDRERLIHDLNVHQIELEMQNRELREAQERLEEATSRYAQLYDFAPAGYCTVDPEGHIQEINLRGAELLGGLRGDLLGKPFTSSAPLKDRTSFRAHLRRCAKERRQVADELEFRPVKRGPPALQTTVVHVVTDPVLDRAGAITAYRTILVDISELKTLESRLRLMAEAGRMLAGSLEASSAVGIVARLAVPALADVCIIDLLSPSGKLEREMVRLADPEKQETLAKRFQEAALPFSWVTPQARVIDSGEPMLLADALMPELRSSYDERSAGAFRAAGVRSLMVVPLHARGRTIGTMTLASAESDRVYSKDDLQVAWDLAARVAMTLDAARLYADAQRAIAARDGALALVSHDLRNPLGIILMRIGFMLSKAETDLREESRTSLEIMKRSAQRMNHIIQDLLDVSSMEAGRFTVDSAPHLLAALTSEAMEDLQVQAAAKSLRLTCDLDAIAGIEIDCDRERVMRVLSNLVGNAIKFSEPGGTITVRTELGEADVRFSVTDNGPGIPAADQPQVFDRFWQAQKTARMGTGLGLSIARGIVEAHGGHIWVESTEGEGSTFFFTLPRVQPETTGPVRRAPSG